MDQFIDDIAASLATAGLAETDAASLAPSVFSVVETSMQTPAGFQVVLRSLAGRWRTTIEAAVGGHVDRLLIAPVPDYLQTALPDILAEFPSAVIADTFKAGRDIAGRVCVTLEQALADHRPFDAYMLGTVDQRIGAVFRGRFPRERTVAAAELMRFGTSAPLPASLESVARFRAAIADCRRPLLVLTAYLDSTMGPTLDELDRQGFQVFVLTRRPFAASDSHIMADPGGIGTARYYVADFKEMLWLLRNVPGCPILVSYARFFMSDWDLRNAVPLIAYSIAVLRAARSTRLLHLYDAYQVCLKGLEAEATAFSLYRVLLDLADGIIVNSGAGSAIRELLSRDVPVIEFLRYGPRSTRRAEPDPGVFSVAVITHFAGEVYDPTRETGAAIRSLLRQGIRVHYYTSNPGIRRFLEQLSDAEAENFVLHDPIRDQRVLVSEISRCHAGWFVADMACCVELADRFEIPWVRKLARSFVPTAVATAGILYGCAGLPTFFNTGNFGARLFPPAAALEIDLAEIDGLAQLITERDWPLLRRQVREAEENFVIEAQIPRLTAWLNQFYSDR